MKTILVGTAAFGCIKGPSGAGKTEIPAVRQCVGFNRTLVAEEHFRTIGPVAERRRSTPVDIGSYGDGAGKWISKERTNDRATSGNGELSMTEGQVVCLYSVIHSSVGAEQGGR